MPLSGQGFEVVCPQRNRNWAHPEMNQFMQDLGRFASSPQNFLGSGTLPFTPTCSSILIGDMSQPMGGPMTWGHASHQSGLDGDIRLNCQPTGRTLTDDERRRMPFTDMATYAVPEDGEELIAEFHQDRWQEQMSWIIRQAAMDSRVQRMFISPPIKRMLCEYFRVNGPETAASEDGESSAKDSYLASDRARRPGEYTDTGYPRWLAKVQAYYGHSSHFHVRLNCPSGSTECQSQSPPTIDEDDPSGVGCAGSRMNWWLSTDKTQPSNLKDILDRRAREQASTPEPATEPPSPRWQRAMARTHSSGELRMPARCRALIEGSPRLPAVVPTPAINPRRVVQEQ